MHIYIFMVKVDLCINSLVMRLPFTHYKVNQRSYIIMF